MKRYLNPLFAFAILTLIVGAATYFLLSPSEEQPTTQAEPQPPQKEETYDVVECSEEELAPLEQDWLNPRIFIQRLDEAESRIKEIIPVCQQFNKTNNWIRYKYKLAGIKFRKNDLKTGKEILDEMLSDELIATMGNSTRLASEFASQLNGIADPKQIPKLCKWLQTKYKGHEDTYFFNFVLMRCHLFAGNFKMSESFFKKVSPEKSGLRQNILRFFDIALSKNLGKLQAANKKLEQYKAAKGYKNLSGFPKYFILNEEFEIQLLLGEKDKASRLLVTMQNMVEQEKISWIKEELSYLYAKGILYYYIRYSEKSKALATLQTIIKSLKMNPFWKNHSNTLPVYQALDSAYTNGDFSKVPYENLFGHHAHMLKQVIKLSTSKK